MIKLFKIITLLSICLWNTAFAEEIIIGKNETLDSKILDEKRRLYVSLPEGYEDSGYSYPVLYFTDANVHFDIMFSTVQFLAESNLIPPIILIGIETGTNRTRDLTPKVYDKEDQNHPWFKNNEHGGASQFLAFIEQELIPHVNKKYRTADFKVFSGHSIGGLFGIYAYLNKPNLFDGYIAISPSLGWDKERIVNEVKEMVAQKSLPKKPLYLSKGNEQGTLAAGYKSIIGLFDNNTEYPVTTQKFPDENHLTVVFDSQFHGLKAIFNGWELPYMESSKGINVVKAHNKKVKDTYKVDFTAKIWLINLGNSLHYKKDYHAAIEAYKYNINLFPDYYYTYFRLGNTYEEMQDIRSARINYEKANELVPNSNPYKQVYEQALKRVTSAGN